MTEDTQTMENEFNGYNEYNDDDDDDDDDDDNNNNNSYDRPTLNNRTSQQRPQTEKKISKKEFKKYRGLIRKRLSDKQRMPFQELISRNIHAGLTDELNEKKPMEKSKKILQLNRRLSHRPHPSDIRNDDELPLDLKKADSEYYKLYKYRDDHEINSEESDGSLVGVTPPRNRTTSDPNPPNKPVVSPVYNKIKLTSIDNPLDWKFGQRSSTKELQIRGIIPEQYADVVHGGKSLEDAKAEWEKYKKKSSMKIKNKIALSFRPTKKDLRDRGIIYEEIEMKEIKKQKQKNIKSLSMKLAQRIDPNEADQRAIINKHELFSNIDYTKHQTIKKNEKKKLKLKMTNSINQRSNKNEIISRGIIHQEYLDNDYHIAKKNIKKNRNSIKQTLKQAIPKLYLKGSESNPIPIPQPSPIDDDNDNDNYNFPTFLDRLKAEKKQTSQTLETHIRRRSTIEELQKQGILPMNVNINNIYGYGYDADASDNNLPELHDQIATQNDIDIDNDTDTSDGDDDDDDDDEFVSFLDRMKQERKSHRKSIADAHKRRPTAEDLMKRGILKPGAYDTVYMSNEYANSLNNNNNNNNNNNKSSDDSSSSSSSSSNSSSSNTSSSDNSQDEYPTFLDRMREEKEKTRAHLEIKHSRRPSQQDLEDQGIVAKGYFANMQVALTKQKQRRASFTTELASFFQQRPDIAQMLTKGLVAAEFIGMDAFEMANKRKAIKSTLNRKLNKKRRPTMDDLEMRGIVPHGYFNDAQKAVIKKHTRRMTAEKELGNFLPQRMNPRKMMEKGLLPKHQFENIMGRTLQITEINESNEAKEPNESNESESNKQMNKQQQAFSVGALGVAGVFAQKMVKQTIKELQQQDEQDDDEQDDDDDDDDDEDDDDINKNKNKNKRRVSSGIGDIVLDLPQYAEHNLFAHDNWTQNLYESLLNSLQFGQILQIIEKEKENNNNNSNNNNNNNNNWLQTVLKKYEKFERLYHTKMNTLQREKSIICEEIIECETKENESLSILTNLISEHSSLEQKIRPQMKMLLHKMTLVEQRINNEKNLNLRKEYEKELNYYETYITELKNVFILTNNIRSKYQNTIRTLIEYKTELNNKLLMKDNEINELKIELNTKFKEFHQLFDDETKKRRQQSESETQKEEKKEMKLEMKEYDPLTSDPIVDLNGVLDLKNKNIDHNLDLLSFRISTIPATDYALRVIELCQLSYIYSNERLKRFFEWFIRFAVQTFIEINYAHTCFTTQNINAINNEINQLKSIQFIAELIVLPTPNDNKLNFDKILYNYLTVIVSYLELLPMSTSATSVTQYTNNNIDHEYVIFHVARYLTSNFIFAQNIISQNEEQNIPNIAQKKVYEWINIILQSTQSHFKFSKDYNKIKNKINKPRNIIKATKYDSIARVRPARAAAIVMDYVYDIHVQ